MQNYQNSESSVKQKKPSSDLPVKSADLSASNSVNYSSQNDYFGASKTADFQPDFDPTFLIHRKKEGTPHKQGVCGGSISDDLSFDTDRFYDRIDRYSLGKKRSLTMADYIGSLGKTDLRPSLLPSLRDCGSYLLFRNYYDHGQTRLSRASFCRVDKLCPLCAMRRGARYVRIYDEKFQFLLSGRPDLKASLVTLTVKDSPDLLASFNHLVLSFRKLLKYASRSARGTGRHLQNEAVKFLGLVGAVEIKRGSGSGLFHPHMHAVVLHTADIDSEKLSSEWLRITGDSHVVDVRPFYSTDLKSGFVEVFKYALKFSEMTLEDSFHCFQVLAGRSFIFSTGLFRGVKVPDSLLDDELVDAPYIELFFKFLGGRYRLQDNLPG